MVWTKFHWRYLLSRNKWFKHYNSAHESLSIESLLVENDYEAVACYWMLLEFVSKFEHENDRGKVEIPVRLLSKAWHMTCPKVERVLSRLCLNFASTLECTLSASSPRVASILVHNWLELQGTWGGKRESRLSQDATDLRLKTKDKRLKREDLDLDADSKIKRMFAEAGLNDSLPNRLKP